MLEGLQASPMDLFAAVEEAIAGKQIPDLKVSRFTYSQGNMFTIKLEYLVSVRTV
jgi:hypothetical protein